MLNNQGNNNSMRRTDLSKRSIQSSRTNRVRRYTLITFIVGTMFLTASCALSRNSVDATPPALESYQAPSDSTGQSEIQVEDEILASRENSTSPTNMQSSASAATPQGSGYVGRYTAEILPVDQVPILPEVAGQIIQFNLEVGDRVQKDEVVLRVDSNVLEAQRAQALAGLQAAQAQLELLQDGADESDIEAARAGVTAASQGYQRALDGPTQEDLTMAEAQLRQSEAAVKQAQAAYDQVSWNPNISALPQSMQLEAATLAHEAAQAQYDKIAKGATDDVIAGAYAQLAGARAQLQALEEGAKPAQIQSAQAQVNQAETALYLAQLQLDKSDVRAPMDGIVASVTTAEGGMAAPGNPVAVLLSPDVEIVIAVEESRLPLLYVGQPATIRVDAYPDQLFDGEVTLLAPTLDPATRTIQVTIRPTDETGELLPGMFATVDLGQ